MTTTQLLTRKTLMLSPCLFIVFTFSVNASAGGMADQTDKQRGNAGSHKAVKHKTDPDELCGPLFIREEDGTTRMVPGAKNARCFKHYATVNERGFCKKGSDTFKSYACNTEGLLGCDSTGTLPNGGSCRTIDTGGGKCNCACK